MGSGLDEAQKALLLRFAAVTGASVVHRWEPAVTHVVCGLDTLGLAR